MTQTKTTRELAAAARNAMDSLALGHLSDTEFANQLVTLRATVRAGDPLTAANTMAHLEQYVNGYTNQLHRLTARIVIAAVKGR